jgi:lysophospholipase L1-like esterase
MTPRLRVSIFGVRAAASIQFVRWCFFLHLLQLAVDPLVNAGHHTGLNRLAARSDDVIVFCGGEDVVAMQHNGYLETLLTLNWADKEVRFRNLGWEGDTVYEQPRQLNFGSWSNQFQRAGATVIFMQFGQSESLKGQSALPEFVQACHKLLDEFAARTQRIVLLSPTPFYHGAGLPSDWPARNDELNRYVDALRTIAQERRLPFVDLFTPLRKAVSSRQPLTRDGLHLNAQGHWLAAQEIVRQLGLRTPSVVKLDPANGTLSPLRFEQLRYAIVQKNQFWFDYWRPMNWAFLRGDRTEQPSSRDHRDPKTRWFPQELEKFQTLIREKEQEIAARSKNTR